jgi:hypothetical protein
MPAHVRTRPSTGWRRRRKPIARAPMRPTPGLPLCEKYFGPSLEPDEIQADRRRRRRLLRQAQSGNRARALAALRALAKDYFGLRLPLVEARWKLTS